MTTATTTIEVAEQVAIVRTISRRELLDILVRHAIDTNGRGTVIAVDYVKDMVMGKDLLASARLAFPNGVRKHTHVTLNVNYDYGRKVENRTGEAHQPVGNWEQALIINGKPTSMTVNRKDTLPTSTSENTLVREGAPVYLRGEPMTEAQRAAGFAKNDGSFYTDNSGQRLDAAEVAKHYPNRKPQVVNHRTIGIDKVVNLKIKDITYHIAR